MFYGHIYTIDTVHSTEDWHCASSAVTSFLRNIVDLNDSRGISFQFMMSAAL